MHIKNEIHLSLLHGEPIAFVSLDLSTDHNTLLNRLKSRFGWYSMALKWFTSYLSQQFQAIKVGSTIILTTPSCLSICLKKLQSWLLKK